MQVVDYHDIGVIEDSKLKFAVIAVKHKSKWIFVRRKERKNLEYLNTLRN
ncbi:hypothetical protein NNC19_10500 [Clostridium sp. SHJSY1]|nr:hypothetical protein [Clostridium sp. SHJSY1]MDS0526111.1 hypothetical protein [Clostridium sp. SHJSY1]